MRKTEVLLNSFVYSLYLLAACLCGVGVDFLVLKVLDSIIVVSPFLACVLKAIIYFAVTVAVVFVLAYKEGYKEASFFAGETVVSMAIATLVHFLFAFLFNFNQFFAGGVKFYSAIFVYGDKISSMQQISDIRYRVFMPVFLVMAVILGVTLILAKKLGCNSRLVDRKVLTGKY